jgi:hypothetical protein
VGEEVGACTGLLGVNVRLWLAGGPRERSSTCRTLTLSAQHGQLSENRSPLLLYASADEPGLSRRLVQHLVTAKIQAATVQKGTLLLYMRTRYDWVVVFIAACTMDATQLILSAVTL